MGQIDLKCVKAGNGGYNFFTIEAPHADYFYGMLKSFWSNRAGQADSEVRGHTTRYRTSNMGSGLQTLQSKMSALYEEGIGKGSFSLIDLGGASGSIFYYLNTQFPADTIDYLLVEPFRPFVEDFLKKFRDQKAMVGDAEAFLDIDDSEFASAPYTVFFSSGVLCMIKPAVAADVIRKAARLAANIVLWDMAENAQGELDPERPVIFDYHVEGGQWYFAHHFERHFADAGFEIVSVEPTTTDAKPGWATIHARARV